MSRNHRTVMQDDMDSLESPGAMGATSKKSVKLKNIQTRHYTHEN